MRQLLRRSYRLVCSAAIVAIVASCGPSRTAAHTAAVAVAEPDAPASPCDVSTPGNNGARSAIRWAIRSGGRRTYTSARTRGLSVYQSVLSAQDLNPTARAAILAYGEDCTERFVRKLGS